MLGLRAHTSISSIPDASGDARIARVRDGAADEPQEVRALTEDQLGALLTKLPDEHRLFHRFLFETDLRISEAIEVRFGDVDGPWLNVDRRYYRGTIGPPKGRKRRRIRLGDEMGRTLWRLRTERRAGSDELMFPAERGGRIIPSNLMRRVLKPAAVRAGLGRWVDRPARAEGGWNAVQVQKFLGHSDPGFTLRTYVHLLPEDLPDTSFLGAVGATVEGNTGATSPADTGRQENLAAVAAEAV